MLKQLRSLLTLVAGLLGVLFILFVINQTYQIVSLARAVDDTLGDIVLYGLLFVYGIVTVVPIYIYFSRPKALRPPADEGSQAYERFLKKLSRRLMKNPHLTGDTLNGTERAVIKKAIKVLDDKADEIIKQSAATVFLMTAISQSGRLDALLVLLTQTRLIYAVARVYNQRPHLRELVRLYANVGATAFLAAELDDLDFSRQIEPVITAVAGSTLTGMIPGFSAASALVTRALMEGAANAFMTLRVGIIARQYCGLLTRADRKSIRRSATTAAAQMLGSIVMSSAKSVVTAITDAAKRKLPGFLKFGRTEADM